MRATNELKPEISAKTQAFKENSSKTNSSMPEDMARGAGFEPKVEPASLSIRIYDFLVSNGPASLRDIYEALDESPSSVGCCLRRLWKRDFVLRTRQPAFEFETCHKGRAGIVGHTRAVNHYVVNDGREIPCRFVSYDERKKDGRSRDVESKASKILNFLRENKDKAFYSKDITKELKVK